MKKCIAERTLMYSLKGDAERKELTIRIGEPFLDENGIARCPVEWDGLFEEFSDIYGIDSIHALHLATDTDSLIRKLDKKYDFFWITGEPYFDE